MGILITLLSVLVFWNANSWSLEAEFRQKLSESIKTCAVEFSEYQAEESLMNVVTHLDNAARNTTGLDKMLAAAAEEIFLPEVDSRIKGEGFQYHELLEIQARTNASIKILRLLWTTNWKHPFLTSRNTKQGLIREAMNRVCSSCDRKVFKEVKSRSEEFYQTMLVENNEPRLSLEDVTESLNTDIKGLNSLLETESLPMDIRYVNYLEHLAELVRGETGGLLLAPAMTKEIGSAIIESDFECDGPDCSLSRLHSAVVTPALIQKAINDLLKFQKLFWSRFARKDRITLIQNIYRYAPGVVIQVHLNHPEFNSEVCPNINLAMQPIASQNNLEYLIGWGFFFGDRMGWTIAAGIVGFGGTFRMISTRGAVMAGVAGPLLPLATGIIAVVTVIELYHRAKIIKRKKKELEQWEQQAIAGNGAGSSQIHLIRYLGEQIDREKRTFSIIVAYEVASLLTTMKLASFVVQTIPRSYRSIEEVANLLSKASVIPGFKRVFKKVTGQTFKNVSSSGDLWRKLSIDQQLYILQSARTYVLNKTFHTYYFFKELIDAWFVDPNFDMPGNGEVSCKGDEYFMSLPCFTYCEKDGGHYENYWACTNL